MKTIELPPYAPTLIESTRAIGYSLEAAVADIIDNSVTAGASNVDLFFFPIEDEYVAILDNGKGMDEDELNIAMQYGSKNPMETRSKEDLGRFGLGLKTASLSQCRVLTVVSKQGSMVIARRWDIDFVTKTGLWSLLILEEEDILEVPCIENLKNYESGTLVVWQNLDRLKTGEINFEQSLGRKIDSVREHLSLVYHRYLTGEKELNKLKIQINSVKVTPIDPFLEAKSIQSMDDETLVIEGKNIIVRPYILPHISKLTVEEIKMLGGKEGIRRQQGFYVYRNKRLLVWGTWFRMMRQGEMSKLARIRVDIPNDLDDLWTLDIKKSSAIPPAEVRMNLKSVIDKMAERSKRTWTYRGKRETDDSIVHVWNRLKTRNGGYIYEINRDYPLLEEIGRRHPDVNSHLMMLVKQIEENIPLNSLYTDLTNDEKIENDSDIQVDKILNMIKEILATTQLENQDNMVETLKRCEPFNEFSVEIDKAYKDGKL